MDFKINRKYEIKKGITLIELLIYMAGFSILLTGFLSTSMYLQKQIQQQIFIYKAKECIYIKLDILQQYLNIAESVEIQDKSIRLLFNNKSVELGLNSIGNLEIRYIHAGVRKIISECTAIKLSNILFTMNKNSRTISAKNDIQVQIEFMDIRKKIINIQEHTTTPNLAPSPIF